MASSTTTSTVFTKSVSLHPETVHPFDRYAGGSGSICSLCRGSFLPGRQILYLTKLHLAHAGAGPQKDKENEIGGGGGECCGAGWRVSTRRVVL